MLREGASQGHTWVSAQWVCKTKEAGDLKLCDSACGSKAAELAYAGSHFEPSFDSVAKPQGASAKVAEDVVDAEDETNMAEAEAAEGEAPELQSRDEGKTPDQQHLLGLDEAHADDPLAQIVVLQKGLQILNSESQQILARQRRYHAAVEKNDKDLIGMVGGAQQCQQRIVDIQELYRKIRKLEYVDVVPKQDSDGADNDMSIDAAMNRWQQQRPASAATASSGTGA